MLLPSRLTYSSSRTVTLHLLRQHFGAKVPRQTGACPHQPASRRSAMSASAAAARTCGGACQDGIERLPDQNRAPRLPARHCQTPHRGSRSTTAICGSRAKRSSAPHPAVGCVLARQGKFGISVDLRDCHHNTSFYVQRCCHLRWATSAKFALVPASIFRISTSIISPNLQRTPGGIWLRCSRPSCLTPMSTNAPKSTTLRTVPFRPHPRAQIFHLQHIAAQDRQRHILARVAARAQQAARRYRSGSARRHPVLRKFLDGLLFAQFLQRRWRCSGGRALSMIPARFSTASAIGIAFRVDRAGIQRIVAVRGCAGTLPTVQTPLGLTLPPFSAVRGC